MIYPDPIDVPCGGLTASYSPLDGLRVDGARWSALPRDAAWKGRTVYLCGAAPWLALGAAYLTPGREGDFLTAPYRGKPTGLCWSLDGGGSAALTSADAWDLPSDPWAARAELLRIADALAWESDLAPVVRRWRDSSSSLAAALASHVLGPTDLLGQLRPRWRSLARASFHTGPQLALSGGGPSVVHLDRVAAYLSAMRAPMPVATSYVAIQGGPRWERLRGYEGSALATVEATTVAALGPLPVRHVGGSVWPVGRFWGAWSIGWLREAEESGDLRIVRVHDAQICDTAPWLEPLADIIDNVQDKRIRKQLYTRTYGLFAAQGRWIGRPPTKREALRIPAKRLNIAEEADQWGWHHTGGDAWGHHKSPLYRPDLAAFIAGHNAQAMIRAVRAVPAESVHLAHVDALLIDAAHAPTVAALGGWAEKHSEAPARVYGTGTYQHGKVYRAQGEQGAHDPAVFADLMDRRRVCMGAGEAARSWTHGGPAASVDARSVPLPIRQHGTIRHVATWRKDAWSGGDWRRRGTEGSHLGGWETYIDADPENTALRAAEEAAARNARSEEAERRRIRFLYGPGADG